MRDILVKLFEPDQGAGCYYCFALMGKWNDERDGVEWVLYEVPGTNATTSQVNDFEWGNASTDYMAIALALWLLYSE